MRGKITKNPQFYDRHETNYSRLLMQEKVCKARSVKWEDAADMIPDIRREEKDAALATARRLYLYAIYAKARAGRMKIGEVVG